MFRVGIGQDSHRIQFKSQNAKCKIASQNLKLGGVVVSEENIDVAKSDGDVVLHALVNALSSALGGGSVSNYADPLCGKGVTDSKEYVKEVLKKMGEYKVNNISVAIEAGEPKLETYFEQIKESIAKIVGVSKDQVGLTATSGEGLNSFGKGEGIQAFVMASLIYNG